MQRKREQKREAIFDKVNNWLKNKSSSWMGERGLIVLFFPEETEKQKVVQTFLFHDKIHIHYLGQSF